ncbi:MAG: C25 family cysteine peptidase [Chloroflexi bacterium]|nr:C25 family cysteine peptidase [Chloroflexota bacterium]
MSIRSILEFVVLSLLIVALVVGPAPATATVEEPVLTWRVQTPEYRLDAVGLTVPEAGRHDVPGAPLLPAWGRSVALPAMGAPIIAWQAATVITLTVAAPLPAAPVPDPTWSALGSAMEQQDALVAVPLLDRPDPAIYTSDAFYPASPVQAVGEGWQRGERRLSLRVYPFQYNPAAGLLRYYPDLTVTVRVPTVVTTAQPDAVSLPAAGLPYTINPAAQFIPGGGSVRIRTAAAGLYRLTYADLVAAGVPLAKTPAAQLAISYGGQPVDSRVTDADLDGVFEDGDLLVFYAEAYRGKYETGNVYWLTWGGEAGGRMAQRNVTPSGSEPLATTITQTVRVEFDREYRSNAHRAAELDRWFDSQLLVSSALEFYTKTVAYPLALDDPLTTGEVALRVLAHGVDDESVAVADQSFAVRLNSHDAGVYRWTGNADTIVTATVPAAWLDAAPNQLTLEVALSQIPGSVTYWVYPDYAEVAYPATADAEGDCIAIPAIAPGAKQVAVTGFNTADVHVYDLRDPRHPALVGPVQADVVGSSYTIRFWDDDQPAPAFYLSSDAALLAPLALESDIPSSWGTPTNDYDYIAIVHRSLWDAVQPLLDHRAAEGFRVAKVDVQDIYDEFGGGLRSSEAIRSFLSYAYYHWNGAVANLSLRGAPFASAKPPLGTKQSSTPPQYVLLVGDGHYDFRGVSGTTLPNLIPPFLLDIDPWIGETAADNRYASIDSPADNLPDLHLGRIPARAAADLAYAVNKTLAYETTAPAGDWQRRVAFAAFACDDEAGNFHALSDDVRLGWLPSGYEGRTVYYGDPAACPEANSSDPASMRAGIIAAFDQDALLLQWFGHGSRFRWGGATVSIFNILHVPSLAANTEWPVTFHYDCWSGYFINLISDYQALGETLLLSENKGSVADLSPSGLHLGDAMLALNRGVVKAVLQDRQERIGPAMDAARQYYADNSSAWRDMLDTNLLFGDPALKLRLPPLPVSPAPIVQATGSSVELTWVHLPENTGGYQVGRSTRPYFLPDDPDAYKLSDVPAPPLGVTVSYTDTNALADATTYFYAVRGVNALGQSAVTQWSGKFSFDVVPGQ